MPTGYTADVADGKVTDLRTFALRCARQFGATIMQRDEPMDVLPKLREESGYAMKGLAGAEAELARLNRMTLADAETVRNREHRERMRSNEEVRLDHRVKRDRYNAMLAHVRQWRAPTADHRQLKTFMIDQLEESIRFDCNDEWIEDKPPEAPEAWLEQRKERARESVKRRAQEVAEERMRVAGANAWIQALWESLPSESRVAQEA